VELGFFCEFFACPPTSEKRSSWNFRKVEKHDGIATMVLL
jgi:hypothetical protein